MGVSFAGNKTHIENNMLSKAYNSCPNIGTTNIIDIDGVTFDPPANCNPPPNFEIGQTATVDANCVLTSLQKSAAPVVVNLDANAQAGLGFSFSTNISDVTNNINQITKNTCANVSSTNSASIKDTTIKACKFRAIQNATQNVSCQINSTQDMISKIAASSSASSKGLFGGSSSSTLIIIIVVILLLLGGGVGFYLYKKNKPSKPSASIPKTPSVSTSVPKTPSTLTPSTLTPAYQKGGLWNFMMGANNSHKFTKKFKKNKSHVIIIIIVLILFVFLLLKYLSKNNITRSNNVKQTSIIDPHNVKQKSVINPHTITENHLPQRQNMYYKLVDPEISLCDNNHYISNTSDDYINEYYKPLF